jgi:hypothetical protein
MTTRKEAEAILAQARAMDAQRAAFENAKAGKCAVCASHYGDAGVCDEGKPANSPHRRTT